jgi:hypothetical protein
MNGTNLVTKVDGIKMVSAIEEGKLSLQQLIGKDFPLMISKV